MYRQLLLCIIFTYKKSILFRTKQLIMGPEVLFAFTATFPLPLGMVQGFGQAWVPDYPQNSLFLAQFLL